MLEKLFESLDEKVFTSELKSNLEAQFNEAVEAQVIVLAEQRIEEKTVELEEKAEEYKAILEQEMKEKEANLLDQIDAYLEKVVEEFIAESKGALDESIKTEKADMIIEAMEAMLVTTGVEISKIVEAKDATDAEVKLAESVAKYDAVIEENIKLEKENAKLLKMGVIAEMKEGLNIIDAEKFSKLAELVEFTNNESYIKKLEVIKESVKTSEVQKEKEEEKIVEKQEKINEKTEKEDLTTSFSHLI